MSVSELKIRNTSQVIDLLNRETTREQFRRELLENARLAGATRVDFDGWEDPETGRTLLRVSDNGLGMDTRMLERRIRDLADPEHIERFGIGGRIAASRRNAHGGADCQPTSSKNSTS